MSNTFIITFCAVADRPRTQCARLGSSVDQLMTQHKGKIRVEFRDFPVLRPKAKVYFTRVVDKVGVLIEETIRSGTSRDFEKCARSFAPKLRGKLHA